MCQSAVCAERRARRVGAAGVEPVLEDVEVERAEVLRAEGLQLLRHQVELVARVVRGHLLLHLRGQRQRVAVDLDHLAPPAPHASPGRSPRCWRAGSAACCGCAGSSRPRASGSRRRSSARPSSRCSRPTGAGSRRPACPRPAAAPCRCPCDFDILRPSPSTTKPWVSSALYGGTPFEHARHQQRRMEPAAVLVGAFEVEVGREARSRRVRAAQHRVVRGARVEPDVERVAALLVLRRFGAQEFLGGHASARPRCRPSRRASPPARAAPACADAARRSPGAGRTASARPTGAGATASSPGGWRSCRAGAPCPRPGRTAVALDAAQRASRAGCLPSPSRSCPCAANHCVVARKITGVLWRQQCM